MKKEPASRSLSRRTLLDKGEARETCEKGATGNSCRKGGTCVAGQSRFSRSSRLSRFSRPRLTNDELERTEGCRHRSQACSPQGVPMPIF